MSKKDYYEVLGIKKTASDSEIKQNYRKLCKQYHPDKNPDDKTAEENFKNIAEAYEVLSNPEKKANYDQFGHNNPRNRQESHMNNYQAPPRVGEDMQLIIKLSLEEIYRGIKKQYKYNHTVSCDVCGGHGGTEANNCGTCGGSGFIMQAFNTPMGQIRQMFLCPTCDGTGLIYNKKCDACNSTGVKNVEEIIEVDIPSGVIDSMTFVMSGKGHAIKSGQNGNLHVRIMELPHPLYVRNGSDLKLKLNLSFPQLVLGDKVEVDTIEGSKIRINIPEYSDVGSDLRIKNKGLKAFKNDSRGDMIITLNIEIPKELDDETKALIIDLKEKLK